LKTDTFASAGWHQHQGIQAIVDILNDV